MARGRMAYGLVSQPAAVGYWQNSVVSVRNPIDCVERPRMSIGRENVSDM